MTLLANLNLNFVLKKAQVLPCFKCCKVVGGLSVTAVDNPYSAGERGKGVEPVLAQELKQPIIRV